MMPPIKAPGAPAILAATALRVADLDDAARFGGGGEVVDIQGISRHVDAAIRFRPCAASGA